VQTKNESAAEVVGLVQAEIDRLMKEPIPADELAARKLTLIGGFSRSVETTAGLAAAIRTLVVANRSPAELKERIGQLEAVSGRRHPALCGGASRHANRRLAVAGEASTFGAALKASEPGWSPSGQDALDLERSDGLSRR
jgi:zinc protease